MPDGDTVARAMRVVITEDSKTIRGFLCRQVKACLPGVVPEECEHGEQAMDCLASGPTDLVITDLQMPRLGGVEFLQEGRARGLLASAAIIVISSAISPGVRQSLSAFERIRFLRKPATGQEISDAILALLAEPVGAA